MKIKKVLAATLATAMLAGGALAAEEVPSVIMTPINAPIAEPIAVGEPNPASYEVAHRNDNEMVLTSAPVMEKGEDWVLIGKGGEEAPLGDLRANVSDKTVILDGKTGEKKTFADIKKGELLYIYTTPRMTFSLPPQSHAELILVGLTEKDFAPHYSQINKVDVQENGDVKVLTSDMMILTLTDKTKVVSGDLKNVKVGDMILAWYEVALMSYPGQAGPSQAMIFPGSYAGSVNAQPGKLTVNGKELTLTEAEAPFVQDGKLMVPVRKLAEALGCTVAWDAAKPEDIVITKDGKAVYTLTIGGENIVVDGDMVMALATPAFLKNDAATFVCIDDLFFAHNVKWESNGLWG